MEVVNSRWIGLLFPSGKVWVQRYIGQDYDDEANVVDTTEPFKAKDKDAAERLAKKKLK